MDALSKPRADQLSGGVFLIGIGLIFLSGASFWPEVLFVLGAASLVQGMAQGRGWYGLQGGVWLIGLGILFALDLFWPGILILVGLSMLAGYLVRPPALREGDETAPR